MAVRENDGKGGCLFVRVCERQRAVGLFPGHTAVWPVMWLSGEPKKGVLRQEKAMLYNGKGGCVFVRVCERQRAVGLFLGHTAVWPMIWLSGEPKNGVV